MHHETVETTLHDMDLPPPRGRGAASAAKRSILLVLPARGHPTRILLRALALARVLGAKLHVLRMLPSAFRVRTHAARDFVARIRALENLAHGNRATGQWLSDIAGDVDTIERFDVIQGEFSEHVRVHARELAVQAIVVAASEGKGGGAMTNLACRAGLPVLVAREAVGRNTIVAATDLRDGSYPVLAKAADWSRKLDVSMVALHNFSPLPLPIPFELDWPLGGLWSDPVQQGLSARLAHVSNQLNLESEPVTRHELHPATAILREAVRRDADLVMVGVRARWWLNRPMLGCVASQVVNRAKCSVLVLPLAQL